MQCENLLLVHRYGAMAAMNRDDRIRTPRVKKDVSLTVAYVRRDRPKDMVLDRVVKLNFFIFN